MSEPMTAQELAQKAFDPEWFRLLPAEAIRHKYFTDQPEYAATWDLYVTREGRIFFPLCAELYYPMMTRLYEYLPEEDRFRLHFRLEDVTIQQERAIRASKIHTSITEINDGRLIMTTHTTARSPEHPDWMPFAYYGHPWEGYQGSHILIYDYRAGKVEDRGIPVPFESIYGAKYDASHNCLYFTGYLRGHLYRYDLDDNRVTDYGKITEFGSFRIAEGPDGNFYSSSRSGDFFRINLKTQQIESLGIELPDNNGIHSRYHRIISYSACARGKLYLQPTFSTGLWEYDPAANTLRQVGDFRPKIGSYLPRTGLDSYSQWVFGMAMDDEECLWYGYSLGGLHLVRWDFLHGGEPENMGLIGSPGRGITIAPELLYRDGKLYVGDTNHLLDGPGAAVIDLERLKAARAAGRQGAICADALLYKEIAQSVDREDFAFRPAPGFTPTPMASFYPGGGLERDIQRCLDQEKSVEQYSVLPVGNRFDFQAKQLDGILLWRELSTELSQVRRLRWQDDRTLIAQTGPEPGEMGPDAGRELVLTDGVITSCRPISAYDAEAPLPEFLRGLDYPAYPGRQYKAVPTAWAPWNGGRFLVGTRDGMLAVVTPEGSGGASVFSLGTAAPNGPIHSITVSPDGTRAYGVAGDRLDLGSIFYYDDRAGLRWKGMVYRSEEEKGMTLAGNELCCAALSPDGTRLAIGTRDRMGCIFLYTL